MTANSTALKPFTTCKEIEFPLPVTFSRGLAPLFPSIALLLLGALSGLEPLRLSCPPSPNDPAFHRHRSRDHLRVLPRRRHRQHPFSFSNRFPSFHSGSLLLLPCIACLDTWTTVVASIAIFVAILVARPSFVSDPSVLAPNRDPNDNHHHHQLHAHSRPIIHLGKYRTSFIYYRSSASTASTSSWMATFPILSAL
ncbi:hypothetical protein LIA77_04957 [Sarocladium implicatum]|nr:hypothetical protein LIA77_04957 [Sarocladium implicatum]